MIASGQGAATSLPPPASRHRRLEARQQPNRRKTNRGGRDSAGQMASQKSKSVISLSFPREYLNWSTSPSQLM
jgi:hypothetical protein